MNALEKLREVTNDLLSPADPMKITSQWALAGRLISRFPVDVAESQRVVKQMDAAGLDALVAGLENPAPAADAAPAAEAEEGDMAAALKAFKKRLKLARLSDESKLGGRYTSGGRTSKIDAIQPPDGFAPEVWKALEAAGKLKHTGQGFYAEP